MSQPLLQTGHVLLHLLASIGVLALLTLAPGPDFAVVTRRALGDRGDGVRAATGVACGLLVWGALAVLGLTALLTASPRAYGIVKLAGVAFLLVLAAQSLRGHRASDARSTSGRPFLTGFATNVLNPKIAVFYTALLPTLAPPVLGAWGLLVLVLAHVVLALLWLGGYALALDRARPFFARPAVRRTLDRLTAVVLVGFALRLATESA